MGQQSIVRRGIDTHIRENSPKVNYGGGIRIRLANLTGNKKQGLIYFKPPFPEDATVQAAELTLYLRGTGWSGGPHTITVKRITSKWKELGVTWNKIPTTTSTNQATSAGITGGVDKQEVVIDVTDMMADVAAGEEFWGFLITVNSDDDKDLYSSESNDPDYHPTLSVEWSEAPLPPTDLRPAGTRAVSPTTAQLPVKPPLMWKYRDPFGHQLQAEVRVQVQPDDGSAFSDALPPNAMEYDSGWISHTETIFDLDAPPSGAPSYAGAADDTAKKWRVKVRDEDGLESDWSDVARFTVKSKGVLTLVSPGALVEETTPPVEHTFTGRTQRQTQYKLFEWDADVSRYKEIWERERKRSDDLSVDIPKGKITKQNTDYKIELFVWDEIERERLPGLMPYQKATQVFEFDRSATPAVVTSLTATGDGITPYVTLTWTRAATPDYFAIRVDGDLKEDRIDPEDVRVDATTYTMKWHRARPNVAHTYEIEAVVSMSGTMKHSKDNVASSGPTVLQPVTVTARPKGMWLLNVDTGLGVPFLGRGGREFTIGETAKTFFPIKRRSPVRISDTVRGYEGTIDGIITDFLGVSGDTYRDRLERMKGRGEEIRLVTSDYNFKVELGTMKINPRVAGRNNYEISVEFWQTDDFTFVQGH